MPCITCGRWVLASKHWCGEKCRERWKEVDALRQAGCRVREAIRKALHSGQVGDDATAILRKALERP